MFARLMSRQVKSTKKFIYYAGKSKGVATAWSRKLSSAPSKPAGLWGKYMDLLERKPLTTKVVTSGVLALGSDVICQKIDSS